MATQRKNTVIPAIPKLKAHSTKEDIAGLAALLQSSFANGEEVTAEAITTVLELTGLIVKEKYEENADTNTFTDALLAKLTGVEDGATADQTSAEIETAYNTEVAEASQVEAEAGTEAAVRRWSPLRVAQAIAALGGGGSSGPVRQYLTADVVVTGSTTTTASDLSITIPTGFSLVWSFFGRCNGSVANDFIVQAFPVGGTMDYGDVLVIWGSGRISGRPGGFGISFAAKGDNDDEIVTMTGGTFPNTTGQDGLLTFRYSQRIFSAETTATLRKGAYVEYELIPN